MLFNVLYGSKNSGKTSTLRLLAQKLSLVAQVHHPKDLLGLEGTGDFFISFYLNNKRIFIASAGDDSCSVEECLVRARSDKSTAFVFCASRTKGQTTNFLHSNVAKSELRWVRQLTISGDRQRQLANESMADFLYKLLLLEIKL